MVHYFVGRNLGHLSRCVANIAKYQEIGKQKVKVYAFKHSHKWLRSNLPGCKIRNFSKHKIQDQADALLDAHLILHDWRKEVEILKKKRAANGPIIGGIYHSDLFVSPGDTDQTAMFKREVQQFAERTTDIFFHMNLFPPVKKPKLSIYYLPIPIIARELSMTPRKVKKRIGLSSQEPFILIHMGGGVGPFRYRYMDEWYEKISKLKVPFRIVVAGQFSGKEYSFPKHIIQAPLFENGRDLIHAADLVISKPGMGILIDCIASGTPLIFLPADSKEREVKNNMLYHLLGHRECIVANKATAKDLSAQIKLVMSQASSIQNVFQKIPQNGAEIMAQCMHWLTRCSLNDLPDVYPKLLSISPFGKG